MKMTKRILCVLLAVLVTAGMFAAASITAFAGVTDAGDGQTIRKTTTNYYTTVKLYGTLEDEETGVTKYLSKHSDEMSGNISDENVAAVIENYRSDFLKWAEEQGGTDISISEEISDYYYDAHDEITNTRPNGDTDVIMVGDPDDLTSGYIAQGTVTINTILDKHQTYQINAAAVKKTAPAPQTNVLPAFANEQMVSVGHGDFEEPHFVVMSEDGSLQGVEGTISYQLNGDDARRFDTYDDMKTFLAGQSAGTVVSVDYLFLSSGEVDYMDVGTLTFTMVSDVDAVAVTVAAPKTGDKLAELATAAGTAGGTSVNEDCLAIESVSWSPEGYTASAETIYTVTVMIRADRGVGFADEVDVTVNGAAATGVSDGESLTVTYTFPVTEPFPGGETATEQPPYAMLDGMNGTWTAGDADLYFRANGNYSKFIGVKVDGAMIDEENYTSASGSTVVNLKAAYLSTLSAGTHTLTMVYSDGEVSTDFTVQKASATATPDTASSTATPKTGDDSSLALWLSLVFVSLTGIAVTMALGKRKRAR